MYTFLEKIPKIRDLFQRKVPSAIISTYIQIFNVFANIAYLISINNQVKKADNNIIRPISPLFSQWKVRPVW